MKKLLFFILFPSLLFSQTQIGQDIDGEASEDRLNSISLSSNGNIIAIGAPYNDGNGTNSGQVRIYKNNNNVWEQVGNDIDGKASGDFLGFSVSLNSDGNIVAIGSPYSNGNGTTSGQVRIYRNNNNIWEQIGNDINGEISADRLGESVSLSSDGNVVAIGAPGNDENGISSGQVRIYRNNNNIWEQIGNNINGEAITDFSGRAVSLSSNGNIVAIGANSNSENGSSSGHVRVYKNVNGVWEQIGSDIDGKEQSAFLGTSVSLSSDGNIIAIGAPYQQNISSKFGYVSIYRNNNNAWEQIGSDINGEASANEFGKSISLSSDGNILAIGAPYDNNNNGTVAGQVKIYKNNNNVWEQIGSNINGEKGYFNSGTSISLSSNGSIVGIGAPGNYTRFGNNYQNGDDLSQARVYNLSNVLSSDNYVLFKFNIYPIPIKDIITIELKDNLIVKNISIYNTLGKNIMSSKKLVFKTSNLSKGIYFIKIETNKGKAVKKIIIN